MCMVWMRRILQNHKCGRKQGRHPKQLEQLKELTANYRQQWDSAGGKKQGRKPDA